MSNEQFNSLQPLDRNALGRFNTPSYLSPTSFRVVIPRVPMLTAYIQSVSIPTISMTSMEIPAYKGFPRQQAPASIDISDQLIVNFTVDENMENWQEMYDWMHSIVPTDENNGSVNQNIDKYSEVAVLVYSNAKRLVKRLTFHRSYPVTMSSFEFNSSVTSIEPMLIVANFEYSHMTVDTV